MADPTIQSLQDSLAKLGRRLGDLSYRRLKLSRELDDTDEEIEATEAAIRTLDQARRDAETAKAIAEATDRESQTT